MTLWPFPWDSPARGYLGVTGRVPLPHSSVGAVSWCLNQHWEYPGAAAGAEHQGLHFPCSVPLSNRPEQGWEQRDRAGTAGQRGVPLQMTLCSKIKAQGKGEEGRMLCLWCLPSQVRVTHAEPCSPGSRELIPSCLALLAHRALLQLLKCLYLNTGVSWLLLSYFVPWKGEPTQGLRCCLGLTPPTQEAAAESSSGSVPSTCTQSLPSAQDCTMLGTPCSAALPQHSPPWQQHGAQVCTAWHAAPLPGEFHADSATTCPRAAVRCPQHQE